MIDATRILTAHGPTGGSLRDVKVLNKVIASTDIVAADAYATGLFGLKPQDIPITVDRPQEGPRRDRPGQNKGSARLGRTQRRANTTSPLKKISLSRISQILFLAFFLFLFVTTDYRGKDEISVALNSFFRMDPLVAASHLLSAKTFTFLLLPGLLVLLFSLVLGRFFCGWMCPLGTVIDLVTGWIRKGRPLPSSGAGSSITCSSRSFSPPCST